MDINRFSLAGFSMLLILSGALLSCTSSASSSNPPYKNPSLSTEKRVADLLGRMTVEEKIGQLICPLGWPMYEKGDDGNVGMSSRYVKFIQEQHGGMLWATFRADPWTRKTLETGLDPTLSARTYNILQHYAIDSTRLGIPIILAEEAPHGHMAIGTTVFPTSIGLASTWDTGTMEEVGHVIAAELRAQGAHIGYGPVIDLAREPRWSRVEETYGEDVFLTSSMASAMMRGTSPLHNGYDKGIVSTLKHFIAYGIPEGGHNGNPSFVGERDLRENFYPTFKSAIDEGALSVMTSYNAIDGVPSTSNGKLLTGLLRGEWGFDGFVVSDLQSVDGLYHTHNIAKDAADAGRMSLLAGVDVDLGANCFIRLKECLERGEIKTSDLDRAVGRVLKVKFDLGLFDNPYVDESAAAGIVRSEEHLAVARKTALQSATLLENNGILPLGKNIRVAVVGPNADNMYNQLGDYTAPQEESSVRTMLDGIESKIGKDRVTYVKGCAVRDMASADIARAVAASRASDVTIAVVGGSSARDFRTKYIDTGAAVVDEKAVSDMEAGEGFDRSTLTLLGRQEELLRALKATGKPLVVVYIEGRPLDKRWASENADALLTMWYPGGEGGDALADVLFGDYNPAGRLPVSVPRDSGQLPVYYNKKNPRGHDYVEESADPLYPFGYGKSYTSFEYSDLMAEVTGPTSAKVTFTITNTGKMDGEEVAQLYVIDRKASTVRPRRQLRSFTRIAVKAGESKRVSFDLDRDAFALYDTDMRYLVEKGDFRIEVGASSKDIRLHSDITLEGE